MSDHILQQLQQSAELAKNSKTVQESISHLSSAFALFSQEAKKLKSAYANLQERFETVNQELIDKADSLAKFTHYLQNILQNISDAILFIDLKGFITIYNQAAEKILKRPQKEVLFHPFSSLFPDDFFGFSMKEALKFGISYRLLYCKSLEISTTFVYEGPHDHHGMILIFKDIQEKQKLQMIANRNNSLKELGEVAATVAHEIRNPLGGIRGYASLLYKDLKDFSSLQEMAGYIIEGTKTLERVVSSILHYAKPIEIKTQTADLGAFLKKQGRFIRVDPAFPKNVELQMHIPNEPLLVPFDPDALKSALLNLFFNAFHAMSQGGVLTVSLLKLDTTCSISISDTGIGMEEEELKLLFSPFYTTKKGGSGLGLVEVQKVIQAHFGSIETRSKKGKGTTFTISLPLKG